MRLSDYLFVTAGLCLGFCCLPSASVPLDIRMREGEGKEEGMGWGWTGPGRAADAVGSSEQAQVLGPGTRASSC